jgi:hypothetical protein
MSANYGVAAFYTLKELAITSPWKTYVGRQGRRTDREHCRRRVHAAVRGGTPGITIRSLGQAAARAFCNAIEPPFRKLHRPKMNKL